MDFTTNSNDELVKKKAVFAGIIILVALTCTVIVQLGRLA